MRTSRNQPSVASRSTRGGGDNRSLNSSRVSNTATTIHNLNGGDNTAAQARIHRIKADDGTRRSSFSRYLEVHPTVHRLAAGAVVLCLAIGLAIGLTTLFDDAAAEQQVAESALSAFAASWVTQITTRFSEAISIATAAAMFAAGGATSVPNINGTFAERLQFINNASWDIQAPRLFEQVPGMKSIQLQSAGLISQVYPVGSAPVGLDILQVTDAAEGYRQMIVDGNTVVQGPSYVTHASGWGLFVRSPVYLNAASGADNFWGSSGILFVIDDLLAAMNFTATALASEGYDFAVERGFKNNATRAKDVMLTSRPNASASVAAGGVTFSVPIADPDFTMLVSFAATGGIPSGNPAVAQVALVLAVVVAVTAAVVGLIFLVALVAHSVRHSAVPHRSASPASGPQATFMALVSVKSMTWWKDHAEDAEQLHADLRRFEVRTAGLAAEHGCHVSGSVSDGCVLVVATDAARLRGFAMAVRTTLVVESKATVKAASPHQKYNLSQSSRSDADSFDSRRSRKSAGGSSVEAPREAVSVPFAIGVAMHVGPLQPSYDAAQDHFSFAGPGIAAVARAVDATRGGEASATDDFVGEHPAELAVVRTECLDDEITVYVLEANRNAASAPVSDPLGLSGAGGAKDSASFVGSQMEQGDDSSVATSLSAQTGTVLRKVIAVLMVEFLPASGRSGAAASLTSKTASRTETPIPRYAEVLKEVAGVVQQHGGEMVATTGATVTVLFNARVATSAAATRAVHTDEALRVSLGMRGIACVSAVATGPCHVATVVDGQHVMCVGAPMTRARWLLAHAVSAVLRGPAPPTPTVNTTPTPVVAATLLAAETAAPMTPRDAADTVLPGATPPAADLVASPSAHLVPRGGSSNDDGTPALAVPPAAAPGPVATPFTRTCVVDGASVEVLRQAFEVQCVGPVFLGDAAPMLLAYVVESEWEMDQDDEWLYRLQQMEEQSAFSALNEAFEKLREGRPSRAGARDAAVAVLQAQPEVDAYALQRLAEMLVGASFPSAPVASL